ncbi:unnamed protein product [Camellia sinensis]
MRFGSESLCVSMEGFLGNGALKIVIPKLIEEGWDDVPTLKLMKSEDMDAINLTQQQKDALEMRSYLHNRALIQYGDKLESSGKSLQELLGLSTDEISSQFGMKRGHVARFIERRTSNSSAPDPLQQPPQALTSSRNATKTSSNNSIHKATKMDPMLYREAMGDKENQISWSGRLFSWINWPSKPNTEIEDNNEDVLHLMPYINDQHQLELQLTSHKNTVLHVAAQFGYNLSAIPQSDGDSNSNPIPNPIKAERPLLKKSRTIADDSRTPHFPGPLFPTVRRISTSTPSSHRSFDPDTTSPNTDPFGTQGDRDWMFPSFLGPHTSRRRVIVQSSKSQKQELSPRSPAPPPARSASMPANCGHSIKRSTNCSRALVPNTNILESAGLRSDSRTPRRAIPRKKGPSSSLLRCLNMDGETPLHIAARKGHLDIVKELIERAKRLGREEVESGGGAAKEMLRATNKDNDTALHMAVRNGHSGVVELLTTEDPEFTHQPNNAEETPLYLAVERQLDDVVFMILKNCKSPAYGGPKGQTALHVAVACPWRTESSKTFSKMKLDQSAQFLLDWNQDLIKETDEHQDLIKKTDEHGWTPFHYAACLGNHYGVKLMLEKDKSVVYITTNEEGDEKTALHIAAANGWHQVMEELLSQCPDCWEMVNSEGQNVLHIAVVEQQKEVIKYIFNKSWIIHLINQKDIEGNTPLHLLATDSMRELWHWRKATNNKNMIPQDQLLSCSKVTILTLTAYDMFSHGMHRTYHNVEKYTFHLALAMRRYP